MHHLALHRHQYRCSIFDFRCTQRPHYVHDRCTTRFILQGDPKRPERSIQSTRIVQSRHRCPWRVFCPLRRYFFIVHWDVGCQQSRRVFLLPDPWPDPGSWPLCAPQACCNPEELLSNRPDCQVIAPFLIILRVAKRRALKSDIISGDISSVRIAQEESSDGSGTPPGGHSATSTGMGGNSPEGLSIEGQHES